MSSVPSSRDLLNAVGDWQDDPNGTPSSADRPVKLGVVDAGYTTGRARVRFDGETTTGTRTYVTLCALHPGDRVVLLPAGRTFVIVGVIDSTPGADLPVGSSLAGYWTTALAGFLLEDGTVQVRATYPALYATIGTTFNTGGETSLQFRLPDSRGRVQVGKGAGSFTTLGALSGEESHVLTVAELAAHTHTTAVLAAAENIWSSGSLPTRRAALSTSAGIESASSGSGTAHNNIQPSIVALRCIKF
jgi:microcystin-dependent protein